MDDLIKPALSEEPIVFEKGYPPNIDAIAKVLPAARGPDTIFTYGRVIYVASGLELPKSLVAHEVVHVHQQDVIGRDEWWERYLADKEFRFQMELAAHRMEWAVARSEGNRKHRRTAKVEIARRLSGPLYGHSCTLAKAKRMLEVEGEPTASE